MPVETKDVLESLAPGFLADGYHGLRTVMPPVVEMTVLTEALLLSVTKVFSSEALH